MNPSDTDDFPKLPGGLGVIAPSVTLPLVQVDSFAISHPGNIRTNNEDHYLLVRFQRVLQILATNLPEGEIPTHSEEVGFGMLVADGMGGGAAGEIASRLAIRTLTNLVLDTPDWMMRLGGREIDIVMQRTVDRFRRIHDVLQEHGRAVTEWFGMGTTMTLAAGLGPDLILAHVGDSRGYLFHRGKLHRLTRDHTVAQDLVDLGILRSEQAATHRLRHALTAVLGGVGPNIEADVHRVTLTENDQVMLCTDGLIDRMDDLTIETKLANSPSARAACEALVDLALKNGGKDNITVVLARYGFAPAG